MNFKLYNPAWFKVDTEQPASTEGNKLIYNLPIHTVEQQPENKWQKYERLQRQPVCPLTMHSNAFGIKSPLR